MAEHSYTFGAGCHYAVREQSKQVPGRAPFVDKEMDHLIRAALRWLTVLPEKELEMTATERTALNQAAARRKVGRDTPCAPPAGKGRAAPPKPKSKPKSVWDEL